MSENDVESSTGSTSRAPASSTGEATTADTVDKDAPEEEREQRSRDARRRDSDEHEPEDSHYEDRSQIIASGIKTASRWFLRISIIIVSLWLIELILAPYWVVILPLALGLIISTVLWPPAAWLRRHGFSPGFAAVVTVLGALALFGGIISAIVPSVVSQAPELADSSVKGVEQVQRWVQGPPLNVPHEQINTAVEAINTRIQKSGEAIASGVFTGVTTAGSVLITMLLSLVLSLFFIKDGDKFLPWTRIVVGERIGAHVTEILTRVWHTLSGFIRTQAIVSLIDSVCIGIGLVVLGIPLALPLCIITFFGGFIPIVGAFVAGALAVLVALVAKGVTTALIVLAIVVAVQQIEGHILQPLLQSRSMSLHPILVLLAITAGSEKYGIVGGFLAVPVVAALAVLVRYAGEQIDLRAGTVTASDLTYRTDRGRVAALRTERLRLLSSLTRHSAKSAAEHATQKEISKDSPDLDGAAAGSTSASSSGSATSETQADTSSIKRKLKRRNRHHDGQD